MADDQIRYDILTQDALRGVVRKVLSEVARTGLPGEHHFFVTFATHAPGVRVSSRLLARYPEDMTIVLQHQYWDLTVNEHGFEVGLSFNGIPERLLVPFTAVKIFQDPSVPFAVQFEIAAKPGQPEAEAPRAIDDLDAEPFGQDAGERDAAQPAEPETPPVPAPAATADGKRTPPLPVANEAQVVSLDAFRKKS
jgi:uncharacterized protein